MKEISKYSLVLIAIFLTLMRQGGSFFYDFPQLFEDTLIKKFQVSTVEISSLYSATSLPNIFSNLAAGMILQYFGVGISCLIFTSFFFWGTFLCFLGAYFNIFTLLIVGRILFGISFDTVWMASSVASFKWFSSRGYMSMVFGFNITICSICFSLSTFFQPLVYYKSRSLEFVLFIYTLGGFASFLMAYMFYRLDKKHEASANSLEELTEAMQEKFEFKDIFKIGYLPLMLVLFHAIMSQCYYQCNNFMSDMLVRRMGLTYLEAKNQVSLIPTVQIIVVPLFSVFSGKYGKKSFILVIGAVSCFISYIFLSSLPYGCSKLWISIALIFYSIFWSAQSAVIWASVMLTIPKQASSVILGLGATLQNSLLAVMPLGFGYVIKDRTAQSYQNGILILTGLCLFGVIFAFIISIFDHATNKLLYYSESDKRAGQIIEQMTHDFHERKKQERLSSAKTDLDKKIKESPETSNEYELELLRNKKLEESP